MAAYIIVEVHVHNEAEYEDYKKLTPASLLPFIGRSLATQKDCGAGIPDKRVGKGVVGVRRICTGKSIAATNGHNKNDFSARSLKE